MKSWEEMSTERGGSSLHEEIAPNLLGESSQFVWSRGGGNRGKGVLGLTSPSLVSLLLRGPHSSCSIIPEKTR